MSNRTEYEQAADQGYRLWLIQRQDMESPSGSDEFNTVLAAALGSLICTAVKDYALTPDEAWEMGKAYFEAKQCSGA